MALFMQLWFALSTIYHFQLHKPFSKITPSQTLSLTWKVTTSTVWWMKWNDKNLGRGFVPYGCDMTIKKHQMSQNIPFMIIKSLLVRNSTDVPASGPWLITFKQMLICTSSTLLEYLMFTRCFSPHFILCHQTIMVCVFNAEIWLVVRLQGFSPNDCTLCAE